MRVKGGPATRNRRKKVLKLAKGYSMHLEIESKTRETLENYGLLELTQLLINVK